MTTELQSGPVNEASTVRRPSVRTSVLIVLALGIVTALVAAGLGLLIGPRYSATAQLLVQDRDPSMVFSNAAGGDPTRRFDTYAAMAESRSFLELVAQRLGRPSSEVTSISQEFTARALPGANVLEFTASAPSTSGSLDIVTAAADLYPEYLINTFFPGLGQASPLSGDLAAKAKAFQELEKVSPTVQVISRPGAAVQAQPQLLTSVLAGAVAGLVLGLLIAAFRHRSHLRSGPAEERASGWMVGDQLLANPVTFRCAFCGQNFARRRDLLAHQDSHNRPA